MSLNVDLGRNIENDVCDKCKQKIRDETAKLSKWDLIKPNKVAKRFFKLLCPACEQAVLKKVRK